MLENRIKKKCLNILSCLDVLLQGKVCKSIDFLRQNQKPIIFLVLYSSSVPSVPHLFSQSCRCHLLTQGTWLLDGDRVKKCQTTHAEKPQLINRYFIPGE